MKQNRMKLYVSLPFLAVIALVLTSAITFACQPYIPVGYYQIWNESHWTTRYGGDDLEIRNDHTKLHESNSTEIMFFIANENRHIKDFDEEDFNVRSWAETYSVPYDGMDAYQSPSRDYRVENFPEVYQLYVGYMTGQIDEDDVDPPIVVDDPVEHCSLLLEDIVCTDTVFG